MCVIAIAMRIEAGRGKAIAYRSILIMPYPILFFGVCSRQCCCCCCASLRSDDESTRSPDGGAAAHLSAFPCRKRLTGDGPDPVDIPFDRAIARGNV